MPKNNALSYLHLFSAYLYLFAALGADKVVIAAALAFCHALHFALDHK